MANAPQDERQPEVKVALLGVPGAGKASILQGIVDRVAGAGVRVGEVEGGRVVRTTFLWPHPLADGSRLKVRLFAVSGSPHYNAASELVMAKCDGLVFVADALGERAMHAREALQAMVGNAQQHGMDLASLPVAMQYHRTDLQPGFKPEEMDAWLGIAPGTVPRFATSALNGSDPAAAVAWVLTELARRHGGAGTANGAGTTNGA